MITANELDELISYLTPQERAELDALLMMDSFSSDSQAIRDNLFIQDKDDRVIPYVPNRAQLEFRWRMTGRDLVLKARQLGMSTEIQAHHFERAVTERARCATLAHDDAGTQFLRRMADRFWQNLPDGIQPPRGIDNATTVTYPQTGSEVFIATAGSRNKGRAGTYRLVHGSEVAFWTDAAAVMAGLMQGVPEDGEIVLESTPNGATGWFYERCMEALDGESDWTLHFLAWWWDEAYALALDAGETLEPYAADEQVLMDAEGLTPEQIKWRRKKQRELGRLFAQEYPEDPRTCFLVSGLGYFSDIVDLERVFSAPTDAQYNPNHRYLAGLDFAQQNDYLSLHVGDVTTLEEVALWHVNRRSWGDMRRGVLEYCLKWHVSELYAEANSIGAPNIEELRKEFAAAGCKTQITPFETTAQSKPMLITGFHWGMDEGGLKLLPDPTGKQEIHAYTAAQTANGHWKYEGLPHDDTVIGRALLWYGMSTGGGSIQMTTGRYA